MEKAKSAAIKEQRLNSEKEFRDWLSKQDVAQLLRGSHVEDAAYEEWEKGRKFIAQYIDRDGKILDIGCANAFFLKCLQAWSHRTLEPYGIDTQEELLEQARALFPKIKDHFARLDLRDADALDQHGMPHIYDIVYWNVWDNVSFDKPEEMLMLRRAWQLIGDHGRFILGFYHADREHSLRMIQKLRHLGYPLSAPILSGADHSEVVVTIDGRLQEKETTSVDGKIFEIASIARVAETAPTEEISVDMLKTSVEKGHTYWEDRNGVPFGPAEILQDVQQAKQRPEWADHLAGIMASDLRRPIWVLSDTKQVINGMHRLTKAILMKQERIKIKRLHRADIMALND